MKKKTYEVPLAECLDIILEDHFLNYPNQFPDTYQEEGGDY